MHPAGALIDVEVIYPRRVKVDATDQPVDFLIPYSKATRPDAGRPGR